MFGHVEAHAQRMDHRGSTQKFLSPKIRSGEDDNPRSCLQTCVILNVRLGWRGVGNTNTGRNQTEEVS